METWISLLELERLPDSDLLEKHAFTNGIALARSASEAEWLMAEALRREGWRVVAAEETERFSDRVRAYEVAEELKKLEPIARRTGEPQFGDLFVWDEEGEKA